MSKSERTFMTFSNDHVMSTLFDSDSIQSCNETEVRPINRENRAPRDSYHGNLADSGSTVIVSFTSDGQATAQNT